MPECLTVSGSPKLKNIIGGNIFESRDEFKPGPCNIIIHPAGFFPGSAIRGPSIWLHDMSARFMMQSVHTQISHLYQPRHGNHALCVALTPLGLRTLLGWMNKLG